MYNCLTRRKGQSVYSLLSLSLSVHILALCLFFFFNNNKNFAIWDCWNLFVTSSYLPNITVNNFPRKCHLRVSQQLIISLENVILEVLNDTLSTFAEKKKVEKKKSHHLFLLSHYFHECLLKKSCDLHLFFSFFLSFSVPFIIHCIRFCGLFESFQKYMGLLSSFLGILGFGIGICSGILVGFFLFIYREPNEVKVHKYIYIYIYYFSNPFV